MYLYYINHNIYNSRQINHLNKQFIILPAINYIKYLKNAWNTSRQDRYCPGLKKPFCIIENKLKA